MKKIIPAVNIHLTKNCNMKCKYCFAKFKNTKNSYTYSNTIKLLRQLKYFGFEKINFVGGEPMLIEEISSLIKYAKQLEFYTSIVTNGSLINQKFIEETHQYIDIIGLSIDSLVKKSNHEIGRVVSGKPMDKIDYFKIINLIHSFNIGLKINTVISNINKNENFSEFINNIKPVRWKVFQVLKVKNENDKNFDKYQISNAEFNNFCNRNKRRLINPEILVIEKNEIIRGSYMMINPEGQFFDNTRGYYTISDEIVKSGVEKTLKQINFDYEKFELRNGYYFKNNKNKKVYV